MDANVRRGDQPVSARWAVVTAMSIAGLACGLVSPGGGVPTPPTADGGARPVAVNVADADGTAKQVYDQVSAGQDVVPLLASVFEALGVSVLSLDKDKEKGLAMIRAGQAAIFDLELSLIAQGYSGGTMVTAQSMAEDLADHGVEATQPEGPLTLGYLSDKMAYLADKRELGPQEALPALIMALARERSRRTGAVAPDPVWGDGLLDPLQYELLVYGVAFSGLRSVTRGLPGEAKPLGVSVSAPVRARVRAAPWLGGGGGFFDDLLKKLGEMNVFEFGACGSAMVYGSHFAMEAEPSSIYHRQTDETNPPPYRSRMTAHLYYADNLSRKQKDFLISVFGCTLPRESGPLTGKTVEWSLDETATKHGRLTRKDDRTGETGAATADYETVDETTPRSLRLESSLAKVEGGIQILVLDLMPDHRRLEAAGRLMGGGGPYGFWTLNISYYRKLALDVEGTFQFAGRDTTTTNTVHKQTFQIEEQGGVLQGQADVTVDTSATLDCGSGGIVNGKGSFTGPIVVYVTPVAPPNSEQLTLTIAPSLGSITPPVADSECIHGNLNEVAWAALASLIGAKFTLGGSNTSYAYTPPGGTGKVNFTLHAANSP